MEKRMFNLFNAEEKSTLSCNVDFLYRTAEWDEIIFPYQEYMVMTALI